MKVLIVVASKHGSTREIAGAIAEELLNAGVIADVREIGGVSDIAGYDAVILGSAIYGGNWLPEARRFAESHRAEMAKVPVWLFSSGPLGSVDPQPDNDPARLAASLEGVEVRDHRIFVGKLDHDDLGVMERLMVKAVHAPYGDFRDWKDIREWARGIAGTLQEPLTAQ